MFTISSLSILVTAVKRRRVNVFHCSTLNAQHYAKASNRPSAKWAHAISDVYGNIYIKYVYVRDFNSSVWGLISSRLEARWKGRRGGYRKSMYCEILGRVGLVMAVLDLGRRCGRCERE